MTFRGHIRNGVVVLDQPATLPEGAAVEVAVLEQRPVDHSQQVPTLYERFAPFIGKAEGLPVDLARNHDHYLHGLPTKE